MDTGEFLILAMCVIVIGLLVFGVMYGRDLRKEIDKELDPFPFSEDSVFGVDGPTESKVIEDLKLDLDAQSEVQNVR